MVRTGPGIIPVCSSYLYPCKSRRIQCKLQPGNRHSYLRCSCHGLGHGLFTNAQHGIDQISRRSWLFLILSGLATGASWLCYYKALQIGDVSKVVPIDKLSVVITIILAAVLLHEQLTPRSILGCFLIACGTLLMVL